MLPCGFCFPDDGAGGNNVVVMQQPAEGVVADGNNPGGGGAVSNESPELLDPLKVVLPVLVIACNRPTVKRNLDQLLK